MNTNNYTLKAQEVISHAQQISFENNHPSIENIHLLLSIFKKSKDIINFVLKKTGANISIVEQALNKELSNLPTIEGGKQHLSSETNKSLMQAEKEAKQMDDEYITVEHLILGIIKQKDTASDILKDAGINYKDVKTAIQELRKGERVTSNTAEEKYNSLKKYAINLCESASNGKLDPVIGRDEEIRRVLQILSRRTKNNPILIGEPGVGKTAIAEGLAHRIISGDIPENLKNKKLFSLDMGALIAGAKYQGEFEDRLKSVIKEVVNADGEIILFIDEIHTLVGAGKGQGAMDAANILKPALARGELRAIGATTLSEYQKYIEKDKALERRFQKVYVAEPDSESALSILRGIREKYEVHHKVMIKDEALISAVELSQRYISDRFLPDKAIDLVDEAAAKLRLQIDSMPEELDELVRKIMQLEIEKEAFKREKSTSKVAKLDKLLANLKEEKNELSAKWKREKEVVEKIQFINKNIDEFKTQAELAERNGDLGKVAEIRYGKILEAEKESKNLKEKLLELQKDGALIKEVVTSEDIAEVVSKWTGIPLQKMLKSEREKLIHLEADLHQRVIGQNDAITSLSDAVRRSRAGLNDPKKPIGSFIFLGTTGVGKTELAKTLAEYMFDTEKSLIRIDMSEYQEKHTVSRLIGSPPGYVGYDEGGQLTEAIRRRPYSVVLLDEIEKAHPDVFNILLQVLEDGRLTDNKGRVTDFKNTIVIMTSNTGSDIIQENYSHAENKDIENLYEKTSKEVLNLLKKTMRPEFLNRIDDIIVFKPLKRTEILSITKLHFNSLKKQVSKMDISLEITDKALEHIAELGYDPQYGARPIKRVMQKEILNELSKELLSESFSKGDKVMVDYKNDQIVFIKQ